MSSSSGSTGADDAALLTMTREECLALLAGHSVGRLAVNIADDSPLVVPVNYQVAGNAVVFRTDPGTKLEALASGPVTFQLDQIDPVHRTGWSVMVRGRAHELTSAETRTLDVQPWAGGAKKHWLRIVERSVSGRRIIFPESVPDESGYL